ncbi:MAG TPA: thioredoxin [Methanoregulaceae archaeon]|jgi:thioredoxin 1|nr:thioredoxin [Methanolinea sp.]MCC7566680.1 thioredoxin [Methanoregulaceae archaeon]MDD3091042.1 thioredoxin [Methanoregulaceae archaeon]MDD5048405.1 thioredoxin [Methanoregulaceae archaeon]MDD5686138.1 thioredoxin [Methanoregulaceae archaeon]
MAKPILLDFYADWCGPCKRQGPILEELKEKMGEKVEIQKIDVDQHMDVANQYGIRVVPTLIILKDGKVVRTLEGVTSTESLESMLSPLVE